MKTIAELGRVHAVLVADLAKFETTTIDRDQEPEALELERQANAIAELMINLPATSLEEAREKARALRFYMQGWGFDDLGAALTKSIQADLEHLCTGSGA
jgi:hypothetical protein